MLAIGVVRSITRAQHDAWDVMARGGAPDPYASVPAPAPAVWSPPPAPVAPAPPPSSSSPCRWSRTCSTASPWLDTIESKSVPGLSAVKLVFESRHRPVPRPPGRPGADQPGRRPPQRLEAAADAPTAVVDGTGGHGVACRRRRSPRSTSASRRAGRSGPGCWRCPGVASRGDLGPAGASAPGPGGSGEAGRQERHAGAGHQPPPATACGCRPSPSSRPRPRAPVASSTRRTSVSGSSTTCPIIERRTTSAGVAIDDTGESPPLALSDVATVVEDHQPLIGDAVVTGPGTGEAGFMLVIEKLPNANTTTVTEGVDAALEELAARTARHAGRLDGLPPGRVRRRVGAST